MKKLLIGIAIFSASISNAQIFDNIEYRSSSNPLYWKNKSPNAAYWQQDVKYEIKAEIDEPTDVIIGSERLTYFNNSPDTLYKAFFNLYNNAYQPDGYLHNLHLANEVNPSYGKYESQKLGTTISKITQNSQEVKHEMDGSIMAVTLATPILPGDSTTFEIDFKTYFDINGEVRRRMKVFTNYGFKHFDGVHWYPRIAVYDAKFRWTTDQHLGREFYGDYGSYKVELTFPNDYVVEASGNLLNKNEMYPGDLRQRLDIKNFATKSAGPVSIIEPRTGKKTWKFYAVNVHDFAFTADPTYRIGEYEWNGIKCISLAQENNAWKWQNAAEYAGKVIKTFSEDFGMYVWPKIIVADARDGMEYPMLTLDGGGDPDYRGLLAHEIGHQWFYGMIGNNETYRAALDEGFTQFLTAWGLEKIDGPELPEAKPSSSYIAKFLNPNVVRESKVYYGYMQDAIQNNDPQLNTHSDDFNSALKQGGGYRHVYAKTSTMLYNLQYVLGDELFLNAMKYYVNKWKLCHPYFDDFREAIIEYTKTDLNWFFDQWMETTKYIDYSVEVEGKANGQYVIELERKGTMQMPIDFTVFYKDGTHKSFHVPNQWFVKKGNSAVLPRWIGWGKLNPEYKAYVPAESKIKRVVIDTTYRLADINQLDNSTKCPHKCSFDHRINNLPDRKNYQLFHRPDVWYNAYDGIKAGYHVNGNYMNYKHVFSATVWYNTALGQSSNYFPENDISLHDLFSVNVSYKSGIDHLLKNSSWHFNARYLDGLHSHSIGLEKKCSNNKGKVFGYFKTLYRDNIYDRNYLIYPTFWDINRWNNTINLGYDHAYRYGRGEGVIRTQFRSSAFTNDPSYAALALEVINKNVLGKFDFNTRTFVQYGLGRFATESRLYLAGANPEEMMENKFVRSAGFIPVDWSTMGKVTGNFQYGGGLNLRGYNNYLAPVELENGTVIYNYSGTTGASLSGELEFDRLVKFRPKFLRNTFKLDTYLFGDVGVLNTNGPASDLKFSPITADAGVGAALTIKKFGPLQNVEPLTIRFDMPLWLNRLPFEENDYLQYRWLLTVKRSF